MIVETPSARNHECEEDDRIQVRLTASQRDGFVYLERVRTCGTCSRILEPAIRIARRGFPSTPAGWLRLVAAVFGKKAWLSLGQSFKKLRSRQWKNEKKHMARHPFKRHPDTWKPICDSSGHRIELALVTDNPLEVDCLGCRRHPRFLAIWEQYRTMGRPWARQDPDAFPSASTAEDLNAAWEES